MQDIGAIILAAGKGKRMGLTDVNKVTVPLNNVPIVLHIVTFFRKIGIQTIVAVVGHAKESVMEILQGESVVFAEQQEQLGTGDAVRIGVSALPESVTDVVVVYGDDAVLYIDKHRSTIEKLIMQHKTNKNAATFLTITQDNPFGLGRIVRENGRLVKIVEEKDATDAERAICEINPGCFVFSVAFIKKYQSQITQSPVTGEYYINNFIDLGIANNEKIETYQGGRMAWRGVNTPEELKRAEEIMKGEMI
jgi:bifunctional UDP-N-acetylglucosamine pyrophosphorylase/glucosamine-1-phosphate N-acetyltransferase